MTPAIVADDVPGTVAIVYSSYRLDDAALSHIAELNNAVFKVRDGETQVRHPPYNHRAKALREITLCCVTERGERSRLDTEAVQIRLEQKSPPAIVSRGAAGIKFWGVMAGDGISVR